jgi:type VI secretion system protein ImpG
LSLRALCSNRDLPLLLAPADSKLRLDLTAPVESVRVLKGPSRPLSAMREGKLAWRFINQLSLNHLSLLDTDAEHGAAALRELLRLYVQEADSAQHRQIDGLRSIRTEGIVRRLPMGGPIAFGRGCAHRSRSRRPGLPGRQPVPAGLRARALLRPPRLDERLHRDAAAVGCRGEILVGKPMAGVRPTL